MSLLPLHRPAATPQQEDALIREARRRQRRRYLGVGIAISVLAALAGTLTALNTASGARHQLAAAPRSRARQHAPRPTGPGPIPRNVGTTLLLWPAGSPPSDPTGSSSAYADDLTTGHLAVNGTADIGLGDYQPLVVRTGDWVVYVGNGATAIRASLTGPARVLGATSFFVPAAEPGHVWLWYPGRHASTIRLASAGGGPLGAPITLPPGSQPIAGTDAGLLLDDNNSGQTELWQPGSAPRVLPGYTAGLADGFGVSPGLVAYGTGCTDVGIRPNAPYEANGAYDGCRTLRVLDVLTGRLTSFPAPHGTLGWVPYQFDTVDPIAPDGAMIAAEAAVPSRYDDQGRLYVLPLTADHRQPRVVPGSAGFVRTKVAWSVRGGWLFFQGPADIGWAGHLWAFQPATGAVRASATPCCQYTVMTALPSATR
jgi:hypothetical protein